MDTVSKFCPFSISISSRLIELTSTIVSVSSGSLCPEGRQKQSLPLQSSIKSPLLQSYLSETPISVLTLICISKVLPKICCQFSNDSKSAGMKYYLKDDIKTSSKKATQLKHLTISFQKLSPKRAQLRLIAKFLWSSYFSNPRDSVRCYSSDWQIISLNRFILSMLLLWWKLMMSPSSKILRFLYLSLMERIQHLLWRWTICSRALDFLSRTDILSRSQFS